MKSTVCTPSRTLPSAITVTPCSLSPCSGSGHLRAASTHVQGCFWRIWHFGNSSRHGSAGTPSPSPSDRVGGDYLISSPYKMERGVSRLAMCLGKDSGRPCEAEFAECKFCSRLRTTGLPTSNRSHRRALDPQQTLAPFITMIRGHWRRARNVYKTPIRILLGYGSARLRCETAQELLHLVIRAGPAAFLAA